MKPIGIMLLVVLSVLTASILYIAKSEHAYNEPIQLVRVGVLPDVNAEQLHNRYTPLLQYLSQQTGLEFRLKIPADYNDLVSMLVNEEIDLAYMGGYTYLKAAAQNDIEPLVTREVDTRFTSLFLVRSDQSVQDFMDLRGKALSFGSRQSTSGHLMPRYFMQQERQIKPEAFFGRIEYSGAHDKTAYNVRDGIVDVGVSNSEIVKSMMKDGRLNPDEIQVLWETPPYPDYVWVVHSHLNLQQQVQIRDAFLELSLIHPQQRKILEGMSTEYFLPAQASDYRALNNIASTLGLMEMDL